jgi:hypothetical protein
MKLGQHLYGLSSIGRSSLSYEASSFYEDELERHLHLHQEEVMEVQKKMLILMELFSLEEVLHDDEFLSEDEPLEEDFLNLKQRVFEEL